MTIYNILFPFLILIILGIVIYILTKHLPEAVEQHEILEKEEKKRWWQVLLGKGENILRMFRVLLLKLDNKLNDSIKKVRERKEEMGKGLKDYRERKKQKPFVENTEIADNPISSDELENEDIAQSPFLSNNNNSPSTKIFQDESFENESDEKERGKTPTSIFASEDEEKAAPRQPFHKKFHFPRKNRQVEEILKKTFTPTEIKVEKEQYWKKKEEMLIQSIVRDPRNVSLYLQIGRLYSNQHNWKDARNAFLEVLNLDKTNIKAKEELKRIDKYLNE